MKQFAKNNPLPIILFTIFLDLLGIGILIPVIPLLLADPRSPYYLLPDPSYIKQGLIMLGYLTAIYPFMQFLAAPILGQLSDKYGRKPILTISLIGTMLSYLIFAYAILTKNIVLLFISRGFDGITGGNISVAQATLADVTEPKNRAKTFGLIGAVFGLGFILGPYIGGKLSDPGLVSWFNASTPFWFAAILSFLNVVFVSLNLHETHKHQDANRRITLIQSVVNIRRAFSLPDLRMIFLTVLLFTGGFSFFTTFFSVYLVNNFSFTQSNIGDFFAYVGLWIAFAQVVVVRQLAKRLSEPVILRFSLIATGIFILTNFAAGVWWHLLLIVPFFAIFNGLTMANITALVSKSAGPEVQGEVLGLNSSVQALAQSIPPVLSGYLAGTLHPDAPLTASGITIIIAGIVFVLFYRPLQKALK